MEYEVDKFYKEVESLQDRFEESHENSLFLNQDKSDVTIKDFPHFLQQIWESIQKDKDLNLPGEKIILARFRCEEIFKEAQG